ncbi:unknown [Prevotella sp. CAG:487]|nr:unknown [Prevotella sp. CAG:487]
MPESPFRLPEEYVQHVGRAFSATQKSLFRIPTSHIRTFHTMVTAAEKPLPHAPAPASAPSRFLFHDFPLSKFFTAKLHKYAFRDLTERQRKDKHPYTISPRHPSIPHIFITPPQRRQPVETQNLASHEKVSPNHTCNNQTVIIAFPTREAHSIARHTHHNHSPASALLDCETQDFASLLLGGQRGKRNHIYCWKNRSVAGKTVSAMTEAGIRRCRRHCAAEAHRHNTLPHDTKQKRAAPHGARSINLTNKIKLLIFHFNGRIRIVRPEHVLALGERRLVAIAHVAVGYCDVLILILQV